MNEQRRGRGRPRKSKGEWTTIKIRYTTVDMINEKRKDGESHDECLFKIIVKYNEYLDGYEVE